jgi:hypothetical protein
MPGKYYHPYHIAECAVESTTSRTTAGHESVAGKSSQQFPITRACCKGLVMWHGNNKVHTIDVVLGHAVPERRTPYKCRYVATVQTQRSSGVDNKARLHALGF